MKPQNLFDYSISTGTANLQSSAQILAKAQYIFMYVYPEATRSRSRKFPAPQLGFLMPFPSHFPQDAHLLSGCFIQHYVLETHLCFCQKFIGFSLLCSILWCECVTIDLHILLLIDMCVLFSLGLSQMKLS